MGKGLAGRGLAIAIIGACFTVAPLAGIAAAGGPSGGNGNGNSGGGKAEVLATLKVENPAVDVKAKGADDFEAATDGQQLRQGDTVRTDATGRAEIDYSADSYTRLDVNTTFKIVKLTESQGERQIEGGLESGRTWNRTEAITESGTFDQSGGGATAAVTGTAFPVECSSSTEECIFTGVVGKYILKGIGEEKTIEPFDQCDSISGELCDEVRVLTLEEMASIIWIQENLLRDLLERGYGPGPFVRGGTLFIQNGTITFEETQNTTATTTTTTQPAIAPTIGDPPLDCEVVQSEGTDLCDYASSDVGDEAFEPTSEIVVFENDHVVFTVIVADPGNGGPVSVVFDAIPDENSEDPFNDTGNWYDCGQFEEFGEGCEPLEVGTPYSVDSFFHFFATYGGCSECDVYAFGTLVLHLESSAGSSAQASVDVTVCDSYAYYGCSDGGGGGGFDVSSTQAAPDEDVTTTSGPTAPDPSTTTTVAPDQDGDGPANGRRAGNGPQAG